MDTLYKSKDIAGNKLIILYLLTKLKPAVSSTQLTKIILDYRYMDFFSFRQHLNELIDAGYVTTTSDNSSEEKTKQKTKQSVYCISPSGELLFESLKSLIPTVEKNRVNRTIGKIRKQVQDELSVTADFTPEDEHRSIVSLQITEGDTTIMKVEMLTGSMKDARALCDNWKANTQELYSQIVDLLLRNQEAEKEAHPLPPTK